MYVLSSLKWGFGNKLFMFLYLIYYFKYNKSEKLYIVQSPSHHDKRTPEENFVDIFPNLKKLKNVEFISWKEYDTIKKSNMPFEELNINDGNKWFTDIYFTKLKSFIKSYLTINPIYKPLLQKYDTKSGIAIHYRLGDKIEMNLQHPKIMYVVMKPEYFIDNCKKMLQEKPGPIYIFSDSHYLVKCILKELKEAIYVNIGYI